MPGHLGAIADADEARRRSPREIGYPVMIKASAGGGGKGMRIAHDDAEAARGLRRGARRGARRRFGDDRVFIEKFIDDPRHIEIQVLGDQHGNVVHLGERECSIQRRHQKVIEEAPSPFARRGDARGDGRAGGRAGQGGRLRLGAARSSSSPAQDRSFYFLEMNTRLQVEHPVTELVTGLDLVEQMIRVAAGEKLPFEQEDVTAERLGDRERASMPRTRYRSFLPSIGRLMRYRQPPEGSREGVTCASIPASYEGGEISIYYDPMIAKLCTLGADRARGDRRACADALDGFVIDGIGHNIPFLPALMQHPRLPRGG